MEREIVRTSEVFHDVTFINFPGYRNPESGEVTNKLLDGVMCEDIALQIPPNMRRSVSVDFATLDYEQLLRETKSKHGISRTMTDEELRDVEQVLARTLFGHAQTGITQTE